MSVDVRETVAKYRACFSAEPAVIARAPGRVNIIGEHTDYNEGFVLPMAIERETLVLGRPRGDRMLRAYAANLERMVEADLDNRGRNPDEPWIDYVVGVADELAKAGKPVAGADLMILGDVPIAAGLSSSASLEMAGLVFFEALGGFKLDGAEAPKLGKRVENLFIGVNTGIMDQFVVRMAKKGHALFLDCRTDAYQLVPVSFPNAKFVIAHTGVSRGLGASKYNERVAECGEAVRGMNRTLGKNGTHLRDFTLEDLEASREVLPEPVYRRARHVITENARTQQACDAMRAGDVEAVGRLMNASDDSLRADYEVTSSELDTMSALARTIDGCHGARMTGAGFGGCTINLVVSDKADALSEALMSQYKAATGLEGEIIVSSPAEGAGLVTL